MTIEFKAPEIGPNADALTSLTRGRGPRRGNLEDLLKYWRPIMKKPGGFRRCVVILMDKPQFGGKPQRICAWLHHELTGKWPNEGKGKKGSRSRKKRRGRSVTRRVRSAGKKSLMGMSPLTEVTSLRMAIRESREFGGILVQPIAGRQNAVEMKAAMFLRHSESLPLFAGNDVKRVGTVGSSSGLGQAAQAAGSIILPGDLSDIRSPIRSQIYETLTPGGGGSIRRPSARRLLRGTGRGARNKFRCPPGFEKGGTFTNSEFSTCGAQILGIASSGPGSPTAEANNRLSRLANTAGLVNEIGDLRKNTNAVDIIRAAQIPAAPKKGSPTRAQTSIDLVLSRYTEEDFPTKVVRRDGVILEPVVSVEALGRLNEFDDMADGSLIEKYEAGQIGAATVPAFSAGLRNVFVSVPDAGAVKISRVGGEISDQERAGLLRSFSAGISRSADLPDPSAAVRSWADGSDGRFTVEFGAITDNGFSVQDDKNELIMVSTAGGKSQTVPRWVYETFLSRSAPRRAKDAPIFEIVSDESPLEKSVSPFYFSKKSVTPTSDLSDVLDAQDYYLSINSKVKAFSYLTEVEVKAPRRGGLGRRLGRGGRAVGGRSRAVFDGASGRYRCPPGTRYGGRFSDQFGRNCGYSLPRGVVNNLVDFGMRVEDAMERRRTRRGVDTTPGDGRTNLKPETVTLFDDAIGRVEAATGDLSRVFEKTEGAQGGTLGRTIGEARRDVDLTPEERELLEGEALADALENLRDVLNNEDLNNANIDEIRKAYKAVEKAANIEAGRLTDNPPRTPDQRTLSQKILDFLKEVLFRLLGIWNEDDERRRIGGGVDTRPGDGDADVPGSRPRVPGGGQSRPRIPVDNDQGRPRIPLDNDQRRPRIPLSLDDAVRSDSDDRDSLEAILNEFRDRAEEYEVAGGGMTADFVESLDDKDLDRYTQAFEDAARLLADDPAFDDINDALNRLRGERDRRDRQRSLVNADLRERFDLDSEDGLADAIEHFEDLADEYEAADIMTADFFERLNDDEIAFFQDVFDRAIDNIGDNEDGAFDAIARRLEDERSRRDQLNREDFSKEDYNLVLKEMNAHMKRFEVAGGGMTADFFDAVSDDDLIKYRRAVRDGLDADAFDGENREALQELLGRMDGEFDRRFKGPGKRPRIESEENKIEDKFTLDGDADLAAAIKEWERRAADFEVTGGGMTQDLVESLSNEELIFFEDAHIRLKERMGEFDSFDPADLDEIINRLRGERERRGFNSWGQGSEPDQRSLINVNNRFPRNGLPNRAYWRDDNYDGDDAAELDRRFGRYYDGNNMLNDRGRSVNRRLGRDSDSNAPDVAPDGDSPDDPDNLSRFSDDELRALLADDNAELPFNIQRISDDDLRRIEQIGDEFGSSEEITATNGIFRRPLNNVRIVAEEVNRGLNGERDPNRLGAGTPDASRPDIPSPLSDNNFNSGRRLRQPIRAIDDADDNQLNNLRGAMQREFANSYNEWVAELGIAGVASEDVSFTRIKEYIDGIQDVDRRRLLEMRLADLRELNEGVRKLNQGDDTREVLRDHLGRISVVRRASVMNLIDNDDANVPNVPDEPFVESLIPSDNPLEGRRRVRDAGLKYDQEGNSFLANMDFNDLGQLFDDIKAAEIDGEVLAPRFRDTVRAEYNFRLRTNDGDYDALVARLEGMSDESLEEMATRDIDFRVIRLRGGNDNGSPPSRAALAQADRLIEAKERRERNLRERIPTGTIDVPEDGSIRDRVGAVLGEGAVDMDDRAAEAFLRSLSFEEFTRLLERKMNMMPAFDDIDDEDYIVLSQIGQRITREKDRREHVRRFQLDVPISQRSNEALDKYETYFNELLGRLPDGNANFERVRDEIRREKRARIFAQSPSVIDLEDEGSSLVDAFVPDAPGSGDIEDLEKFFANRALHDVMSTRDMLRVRDRIQNSPNLTQDESTALLRTWDDRMRNRGLNFERNLPIDQRSADALQRHIDFLNTRMEIRDADGNRDIAVVQAYENAISLLSKQRDIRIAADEVAAAVDANPSLSDRWRNVAKWNFLKARRMRQQKREQKIREIAERRYANRRSPWNIGGLDGLSNMSDSQVRARIRDTYLVGSSTDTGTVTINGEVFTKRITPTNSRIEVNRSANGRIYKIDFSAHMKFELVDSNGNVVKSETHRSAEGWTRGRIERSITYDSNGVGTVEHKFLGLDRVMSYNGQDVPFKGGGYTDELFNNNLLFYRNMGIEKVSVSAASDGNIVWPRIGFREYDGNKIKRLNTKMLVVLEDYRGYKRAKETGVPPTAEQIAAKALVQDDVRMARLDAMLEPHRLNPQDVDALPGYHDFLLALDGENRRNSVAFQLLRGSNRNLRLAKGGEGISGLDEGMLDELFADDPDLENREIANPFGGMNFSSGVWDISDILGDAGGDPRRVNSNLIDPYDGPVDSAVSAPRQTVGPLSQKMNPEVGRDVQRPVNGVPVGTNNISNSNDAVDYLNGGGDVSGVPDEFVNQAIIGLSDLLSDANRLGDIRFRNIKPSDANGINDGLDFNGAQILEDTVTGQVFVIKYNQGRGYGHDEAANELVGRAIMIRMGFAQGQVRLDGPGDPNESRPARGLVGEALHNYLPEGVNRSDISMGNSGADIYLNDAAELDDMTHLMLGDALLFNTDRHSKNWLQYTDPNTGKIRIVPIDMGLGLRGRSANGDDLRAEGLDAPNQIAKWALSGKGGSHSLNGVQKALKMLATDADKRREIAASFDRAIARMRAAHQQEDITGVLETIGREHGNLDSDGWKRAQAMFLERYGWLMESSVNGDQLVRLIIDARPPRS